MDLKAPVPQLDLSFRLSKSNSKLPKEGKYNFEPQFEVDSKNESWRHAKQNLGTRRTNRRY